jgi:hypothetical protein
MNCISQAIELFQNYFLNTIFNFLNSGLSIAIIGSFAGAIGGALGAQRITERAKQKEELTREIRNINAAITVSFAICNELMSMKINNVTKLLSMHKAEKDKYEKALATSGDVAISHNFVMLQPFILPIETLQNLIYEKTSANGRVLAVVGLLASSITNLNSVLTDRNNWILNAKLIPTPSQLLLDMYFGLKQENGNTDKTYPDLIQELGSQTDNGIFYSKLICTDLIKRGNKLLAKYLKTNKKEKLQINSINFDLAEIGVIPDESNYENFLKAFKEKSLD